MPGQPASARPRGAAGGRGGGHKTIEVSHGAKTEI